MDGQTVYLALKHHAQRRNVHVAAWELIHERLTDENLTSWARFASARGRLISVSKLLEVDDGCEMLVKMPSRRESICTGLRDCGYSPDQDQPVDEVVRLLKAYREALRQAAGV